MAIDPDKDVDGFHPVNVGRLATGDLEVLAPCTPRGVIEMLLRSGVDPSGKHVVVVGRSNIVGKPMALLLLRRAPGGNATVSIAHSRTSDLGALTRSADVLIVAVGRPNTITREMVKPGVTVIDVGTNRVDDPSRERGYRVVGDVDFEGVSEVAAAITPVPGGVGPMTIAMLLANTVEASIRLRKAGAVSDLTLDLFANVNPGADRSLEPRPPPGPRVWTVGQINRAARLLLEESLPRLWVGGEVTNFRRQRSGHCYFTLKDESAQLRCVMFRREAARLPADPEEGMTLRAFGGLTLYEARGAYQLVVTRLETAREGGMWKLAFDRLRRQLDAEGLTDPARKRALPAFPATVGIVTSPTGAALRDIVAVIARRAPWLRLLVRGTRVQGRGVGEEIAAAIEALSGRDVDVIVVARGGGSIEDLWGFNEEAVARAVALSPVPVVSGVGHETDVTICDLVADLRAATPSAAAEAVAPDRDGVEKRLEGLGHRLGRGLAVQARTRRWQLDRARDMLHLGGRRRVSDCRARLTAARSGLAAAMRARVRRDTSRLAGGRGGHGGPVAGVDARTGLRRTARSAWSPVAYRTGFPSGPGLQASDLRRIRSFRRGGPAARGAVCGGTPTREVRRWRLIRGWTPG